MTVTVSKANSKTGEGKPTTVHAFDDNESPLFIQKEKSEQRKNLTVKFDNHNQWPLDIFFLLSIITEIDHGCIKLALHLHKIALLASKHTIQGINMFTTQHFGYLICLVSITYIHVLLCKILRHCINSVLIVISSYTVCPLLQTILFCI